MKQAFATKRAVATMTSDGQLTLPDDVRRHLGLAAGDRVAFVIEDDGRVRFEPVKDPTIASLAGVAGKLPRPMSWDEMREIAYEDRLVPKFLPEAPEE